MSSATRARTGKLGLDERGLTIAEIMIALAINSIIVLAVVTLVSNTMMVGRTSENRQELATDFGLLQNYFARVIPNAGGMSLPAESAYWVEDNCTARPPFADCAKSDRLTVATSDEGPACTIKTFNTATLFAEFNLIPGPAPLSPPICCLSARDLSRQHVMFVNGYDYRQLYVQKVDANLCTASFQPGPMAQNDNTLPSYPWAGAMVIPISLDTFYLDSVENTFKRFTYTNGSSSPNQGVGQILADRVLDFQVMLGYDFNPSDGVIDDLSSASDEWLYNAPGEALSTAPYNKLKTTRNALRMIGIGWVIGAPNGGNAGALTGSALNGPVRSKPNWVIQAGVAKFGARSIYVFD